jgi:hypothetical protein
LLSLNNNHRTSPHPFVFFTRFLVERSLHVVVFRNILKLRIALSPFVYTWKFILLPKGRAQSCPDALVVIGSWT